MHEKRKSSHIFISLIIIIIFSLMILGIITSFQKEQKYYNVLENSNVADYLKDSWAKSPTFENMAVFGKTSAPIIMVAYLTPENINSKKFMNELLPFLKANYTSSGKLRIYMKLYVTTIDLEKNPELIKDMITLSCINKEYQNEYYKVFYRLINNAKLTPEEISSEFGVNLTTEAFINCMNTADIGENKRDMILIEKSGYVGISPIIFIGIDKPEEIIAGLLPIKDLDRKMRLYESQIGLV